MMNTILQLHGRKSTREGYANAFDLVPPWPTGKPRFDNGALTVLQVYAYFDLTFLVIIPSVRRDCGLFERGPSKTTWIDPIKSGPRVQKVGWSVSDRPRDHPPNFQHSSPMFKSEP